MITLSAPDTVMAGQMVCVTVTGASAAEVKVLTSSGELSPTVEVMAPRTLKISVRAPAKGALLFEAAIPGQPAETAVVFVA